MGRAGRRRAKKNQGNTRGEHGGGKEASSHRCTEGLTALCVHWQQGPPVTAKAVAKAPETGS